MRRRIRAIGAAAACAATLAACGPSEGDAEQSARQFCAEHGGLARLEYWRGEWPYGASYGVVCRDGSTSE